MQPLGTDKYVNVTVWEGQVLIHLRRYAETTGKHGSTPKKVPTKVGIALSPQEWGALLAVADEVDREVRSIQLKHRDTKGKSAADNTQQPIKRALGNNKFVSVTVWEGQLLVHVRKYFEADHPMEGYARAEDLLPTKKGITLRPQEWDTLRLVSGTVNQEVQRTTQDVALGKYTGDRTTHGTGKRKL